MLILERHHHSLEENERQKKRRIQEAKEREHMPPQTPLVIPANAPSAGPSHSPIPVPAMITTDQHGNSTIAAASASSSTTPVLESTADIPGGIRDKKKGKYILPPEENNDEEEGAGGKLVLKPQGSSTSTNTNTTSGRITVERRQAALLEVEKSLPYIFRSSKHLFKRIFRELLTHHRWLSLITIHSASFPRSLRCISLFTLLVSQQCLQAILLMILNPDDGSCSALGNQRLCLFDGGVSTVSPGRTKCFWDKLTQECYFRQADENVYWVIIIATVAAMLSYPIYFIVNSLVIHILAVPTSNSVVTVPVTDTATDAEVEGGESGTATTIGRFFSRSYMPTVSDLFGGFGFSATQSGVRGSARGSVRGSDEEVAVIDAESRHEYDVMAVAVRKYASELTTVEDKIKLLGKQ
jgi:hypothetical protein